MDYGVSRVWSRAPSLPSLTSAKLPVSALGSYEPRTSIPSPKVHWAIANPHPPNPRPNTTHHNHDLHPLPNPPLTARTNFHTRLPLPNYHPIPPVLNTHNLRNLHNDRPSLLLGRALRDLQTRRRAALQHAPHTRARRDPQQAQQRQSVRSQGSELGSGRDCVEGVEFLQG
jgi:hypothetical protein